MSLKFASNLSFMFNETSSIKERYKLAKDAGFKAVESGFPLNFPIKDILEAKRSADVEQILINVYTGDTSKGELGYAAIPGQEENFKKSINTTIEYAKALNCKKIHVMSGNVNKPTSANDNAYENNLLYAVEKFKTEEIVGLVEPISSAAAPNYYMNSFEKGLNIVKKINSPNLKLLLDVFHLQQISGSITKTIKELMPYIGHVQIAQVPDRNEPDTPGEINYKYVLSILEMEGYNGYVGLEYRPKSSSVKGLSWIQKYGYKL
ncbi:hydroxypyruvate isomerase-like protein Gip [Megalopta genalis]|uniref:hydroxypyruvate isomerase-like protein Gip n=1 Tax=Megalopta genalis TaxID=115081 RepID=UPI0014437AFB|nr:putative hydroxypyruvate isomerase [Megalopta genalis]